MQRKTLLQTALLALSAGLTIGSAASLAQSPIQGISQSLGQTEAARSRSLTEQLAERAAAFSRRAPPETSAMIQAAIDEVGESGILEGAMKTGDKAPDFTLSNAVGKRVSLSALLAKGPVVLTWYRGSWCPYCNMQLRDYQKHLPELEKFNARLVGVSPERPDNTLDWQEKNGLQFDILSDPGNEVARRYGVVYKLPESLQPMYRAGGRIDLAKYNGDDSLELPLGVTYVIDTDGAIVYAYLDTDYRKRADTAEIIAAVRALAR